MQVVVWVTSRGFREIRAEPRRTHVLGIPTVEKGSTDGLSELMVRYTAD